MHALMLSSLLLLLLLLVLHELTFQIESMHIAHTCATATRPSDACLDAFFTAAASPLSRSASIAASMSQLAAARHDCNRQQHNEMVTGPTCNNSLTKPGGPAQLAATQPLVGSVTAACTD
jgi:hypothetical protein